VAAGTAAPPATIEPAPGASTVLARRPGESTPLPARPVSRPTDSVATTLTPATAAADPGGLASVTVRARNTGTVVDELRVTVEGPIAGWAEVETPVLRLMPGTDATSVIRFRPPLVPLALAGQQPFLVRIVSREHPQETATETGVLTIGEVRAVAATIVPATAKSSGTAQFEVRVENQGNRPAEVALVSTDPDEALRLVLDTQLHTIPPGATLRAGLRATPKAGIAFGAAEQHGLRVDVMSEGRPVAHASATLVQQAQLPAWLPRAAIVAGGIAALAVAGFVLGVLPPGREAATPGIAALPSVAAASLPPETTEPPSAPPSEATSPSEATPTEAPTEAPPTETPPPTEAPPTPTPPDACAPGFTWRLTHPEDHVCVTQATVDQARADEAAAASRWTDGAYGPQTCVQGYVWREAYEGDLVCVTGDVRGLTALDNQRAAHRLHTEPGACVEGFVWREALPGDHVCVEPWVRDQAALDNIAAPTRWVDGAYGPQTCVQGYVWREVDPTDLVCVTGDVRTQVKVDDALAAERVAAP
jgi:hypothetical protein